MANNHLTENNPHGNTHGLSLEECLKPTELCDSMQTEIRKKMQELTFSCTTQLEKAKAIYRAVRDMPYSFQPFAVHASETLTKGTGHCYNKANLQVALLRAAGVPAAYALVGISLTEFKPISGENEVIHAYCIAYIDGKWIGMDATEDPLLARAFGHGVYEFTGKFAIEIPQRRRKTGITYYADISVLLRSKPEHLQEEMYGWNERLDNVRKGIL